MSRTDEHWVNCLRAGDGLVIGELRDRLVRNLRRALSGNAHADEGFLEDVAQESTMRVIDRIDQFEGRSRFMTWATSVAIRVAFGELRRLRWKDVSLEDLLSDDGERSTMESSLLEDEGERPDSAFERRALTEALFETMNARLTERQRTALVAELKGMPQERIAEHLGCNRNAVYKLTHDARKKLRAGLEAAGYSADDLAQATA